MCMSIFNTVLDALDRRAEMGERRKRRERKERGEDGERRDDKTKSGYSHTLWRIFTCSH